jgi:serine protease
MTRTLRALWATAACLLGAGLMPVTWAAEQAPVRHAPEAAQRHETARVIVQFKSGASVLRAQPLGVGMAAGPRAAQVLAQRLQLPLSDGRAIGPRMQVLHAAGIGAQALATRLSSDADVEWAVVDGRRFAYAVPNDPLYTAQTNGTTPAAGQWYLRPNSGTVKASINVQPAWALTAGSASVVVAVLDTGVRFDHPDLSSKLLTGYDFVGYAVDDVAAANDGDLDDADASDPGDWITEEEDNDSSGEFYHCSTPPEGGGWVGADSTWHGTQVAGLIGAATDNAVGMASVGRGVKVLPVRVLGKCGGFDSDILAGMRWAAGFTVTGVSVNSQPAKILNLSFGSDGACTTAYKSVMTELTQAGVTVVAAAGNDGLAVGVPANCAGVIAVGGVRHTGTKVSYSNLGPQVAITAPAGNCANEVGPCLYPIVTTSDTGTTVPASSTYSDGNIRPSLGTSFSTPMVAGTVALMLSVDPSLTPAKVRSLLQSTARAFPTSGAGAGVGACQAPSGTAQDNECYCTTTTCGAGLLDAGDAVAAAAEAASGLVAHITALPSAPEVGDTVTLDAGTSVAGTNRTITAYQWEITSGANVAAFTGSTTGPTAALQANAAGAVTVQLTITDDLGAQSITSRSLTVTAASSGGGGGGGMSPWWSLGLLAAAAALRRRPHC